MSNSRYYIKIKDKKIPVIIRNYKNSNNIKMYFKEDILNISKPKWYSINKIIKDYGEKLYDNYIKIISVESTQIKHWITGEKILYKGEEYIITRKCEDINKIKSLLDESSKEFNIIVPTKLKDEDIVRKNIVKCVKNIFKINTSIVIEEKLKYWSKKMNLEYLSFKVNDTSSKYGSCMPKSKKLFFSLKLVMLPDEIIDLIVVHELAHLVHANHSQNFYYLVEKYIPDYKLKNKWLKENSKLLVI